MAQGTPSAAGHQPNPPRFKVVGGKGEVKPSNTVQHASQGSADIYIYIYIYIYRYAFLPCLHVCIYVHIHTFIHIEMYAVSCIHVNMYVFCLYSYL